MASLCRVFRLNFLITTFYFSLESVNDSEVAGPCSEEHDNCTCFVSLFGGNVTCGCLPGYQPVMSEQGDVACQGIEKNYIIL